MGRLAAGGEVFKRVDAEGRTHYRDKPGNGVRAERIAAFVTCVAAVTFVVLVTFAAITPSSGMAATTDQGESICSSTASKR